MVEDTGTGLPWGGGSRSPERKWSRLPAPRRALLMYVPQYVVQQCTYLCFYYDYLPTRGLDQLVIPPSGH